ncbi:hypothetical protein PAECIP111893_00908 [Paenibacillus plantiphilus]|uniref:VWFA domain-containing protein n=1 Tax=Paenibacillus plantiphilus TaxID=2905650 RepID=A0ABN8G7H0_9BACL|nr:VWA domain-containing protein [Paenibacillus plantiphilus]CAH1197718.1 hypothetical protein PAECIP111893_00908 [Paenibacillus plantiphilus]
MFFQSLTSLWFALSLPVIVLLYMLKRTYIDTEISSHLLWNRALKEQEANRPWQKLRRSLLLLLQLLAAALLVLALMNPGIWKTSGKSGHYVLVLDRSASMTGLAEPNSASGMQTRGMSKFEAAQSAALQWLEEGAGSDAEVTVIATGRDPQIVSLRERNKDKLEKAVTEMTPTFGEVDGAAAVSMADALLRDDEARMKGTIVLITDGSWPDAAAARGLSIQSPMEIVKVNGVEKANLAVAAFGVKADPAQPDQAIAVVTLRNDGDKPVEIKAGIYVDRNERPVGDASVHVAPGAWESVTVDNLPIAGVYKAQLEGAEDIYAADNVLYRFSASSKETTALLVTKGNLFLDKALQLAGIETIVVDPAAFEPQQNTTDAVDWIVLDSIPEEELSAPEWQQLIDSKPIWRMEDASSAPSSKSRVVEPQHNRVEITEHAVTRFLSFEDTHIAKLVQTDAVNWGEPIVKYGGYAAVYAGKEDGRPMLLFTFDLHHSDLPLRPEFPILAAQAAQWMSGGGMQQLGQVSSGSSLDIDYAGGAVSALWELVEPTPGLENYASAAGKLEAEQGEDGLASSQTVPNIPGLYRFVEQDVKQQTIATRYAAVIGDQREFSMGLDEAPLVFTSDGWEGESGSAAAQTKSTGSQDADSLIRWIALLLVVVMLMEWGVFSRGRAI